MFAGFDENDVSAVHVPAAGGDRGVPHARPEGVRRGRCPAGRAQGGRSVRRRQEGAGHLSPGGRAGRGGGRTGRAGRPRRHDARGHRSTGDVHLPENSGH